MLSNDFHRKLIEDSQKGATIDEERKYGVHFEYRDLCQRLTSVMHERDQSDMKIKRNNSQLSKDINIKDTKRAARLSYPSDLHRTASVNQMQRQISPMFTNSTNKIQGLFSSKILNRNISSKPSIFTQTQRLIRNNIYAGKSELIVKSYDNLYKNTYKGRITNIANKNTLSKSTTIGKLSSRLYINKLKPL